MPDKRPDPRQPISKPEAEDALRRSGYLLETRVEKLLRDHGFKMYSNFSVPDPITGKGRETDHAAIIAVPVKKPGSDETVAIVSAVVVLECVNNIQPLAFLTKNPQDADDLYEFITIMGMPVHIPHQTSKGKVTFLPRLLEMQTCHHYFQGRVATQWCSFARKGDKRKTWLLDFQTALSTGDCVIMEVFRSAERSKQRTGLIG